MQELKSVTQIEVQVSHVDAFRHVNNARIMEYLEMGRWDIMNLRGRREEYVRKRLAVPVASMQVNFRMPARLGQLLDIVTTLQSVKANSFVLKQLVQCRLSKQVVAEATVTSVIFDAAKGVVVPALEIVEALVGLPQAEMSEALA